MKNNIAPSPAPAEMPSNPGSARLFRSKDCNTIPEQLNEAPTKNALSVLGIRMLNSILLSISASSILEKSIPGLIYMLPIETETIKEIKSRKNSINNIFKLRFKLLYI